MIIINEGREGRKRKRKKPLCLPIPTFVSSSGHESRAIGRKGKHALIFSPPVPHALEYSCWLRFCSCVRHMDAFRVAVKVTISRDPSIRPFELWATTYEKGRRKGVERGMAPLGNVGSCGNLGPNKETEKLQG